MLLFEIKMSTHQFSVFCLCVEAPAISSSICFSSATVIFCLVTAIWIVFFSFSLDLKYFCSDTFSPTVLLSRLQSFYHYFYEGNSKKILLKIILFPHTLSTIGDINYKPIDMYLFKSINRSSKTSCEICSKLAKATPEWSRWHTPVCFC